jgi:hypothetical protein
MKKIRPKHGPEFMIQRDFIKFLRARGWWVERMIGNAFQKGVPDLYAAHPREGQRWIDIKNPVAYEYTKAQCQKWPIWDQYGIGIWIITGATEEEYDKLFKPPNWKLYWKPRYDEYLMDVDVLLDELMKQEDEELPVISTETVTGSIGKKDARVRKPNRPLPMQETDLTWLDELKEK